ncbi:MAG: FKBP-type peptidyl-prolyl cis-trans isomerase [Armatimonadetes bacterium]|nr:FKBP-type peptidyl-prolyl cis-trans isomerase [Armatimonadota bacterium]
MRLMRRTACLALLCAALVGCNPGQSKNDPKEAPKLKELVKTDIKVGEGDAADSGDMVWVMYEGKTVDGNVFDGNIKDNGMPYPVMLSTGGNRPMVIKGWDTGLRGMKAGGERKLEIPYKDAYGDEASGGGKIPPKSDLYFVCKVVYLVKKGSEAVFDKEDLTVGTGAEAKEGSTITMHYKGEYLNGKVFDDSEKRPSGPKPFTVKLGEQSGTKDRIIKGLDFAIRGMKEGGVRKITLPPALVLGGAGNETIAGNQPCTFTVKLLKVSG